MCKIHDVQQKNNAFSTPFRTKSKKKNQLNHIIAHKNHTLILNTQNKTKKKSNSNHYNKNFINNPPFKFKNLFLQITNTKGVETVKRLFK